jgi:hypothetical protein
MVIVAVVGIQVISVVLFVSRLCLLFQSSSISSSLYGVTVMNGLLPSFHRHAVRPPAARKEDSVATRAVMK